MSDKDLLKDPDRHYKVLTQKEQDALTKYKYQFGDGVAFQLNQNPDHLAMYSKTMEGLPTLMTLIHNLGLVWYNERSFTPFELALYQGLAVKSELSLPRFPDSSVNTASFAIKTYNHKKVLRSRTAVAGQVGNGMNVAVVGAFVFLDFTCENGLYICIYAVLGGMLSVSVLSDFRWGGDKILCL